MNPQGSIPNIGFVGLGIMGVPMVRRLLSKGFRVTVWNLEPERADLVVPYGAVWADSPAAVREASDIQLMCVLNAVAVEACCFGPQGFAAAQGGAGLVVDFSTISAKDTRRIATELSNKSGMAWIDSPVSGGPDPAIEGQLTAMVGGEEHDVSTARPVLEALTSNATHMGALGTGQVAKVMNQAIVGTNYVLMAELLCLAQKGGIDPSRLPEALAGGLADSAILQRTYRQMQRQEFFPPKAYARQLAKDMKALADFVEEMGVETPLIDASVTTYVSFAEDGNEMADAAAISAYYQQKHIE